VLVALEVLVLVLVVLVERCLLRAVVVREPALRPLPWRIAAATSVLGNLVSLAACWASIELLTRLVP
jgi:hypothetical protein